MLPPFCLLRLRDLCKTVLFEVCAYLLDFCVRFKFQSSKYSIYSCGWNFRLPWTRTKITIFQRSRFDIFAKRHFSKISMLFAEFSINKCNHHCQLGKWKLNFKHVSGWLSNFSKFILPVAGYPDNFIGAKQNRAICPLSSGYFVIDKKLFKLLWAGHPERGKSITMTKISDN